MTTDRLDRNEAPSRGSGCNDLIIPQYWKLGQRD